VESDPRTVVQKGLQLKGADHVAKERYTQGNHNDAADLAFEIFQVANLQTHGQRNFYIADEQLVESHSDDVRDSPDQEKVDDLDDLRDNVLAAFAEKTPSPTISIAAVMIRPIPLKTTPAVRSTHPMTGTTRIKRRCKCTAAELLTL